MRKVSILKGAVKQGERPVRKHAFASHNFMAGQAGSGRNWRNLKVISRWLTERDSSEMPSPCCRAPSTTGLFLASLRLALALSFKRVKNIDKGHFEKPHFLQPPEKSLIFFVCSCSGFSKNPLFFIVLFLFFRLLRTSRCLSTHLRP
jgi:hypothetical protein